MFCGRLSSLNVSALNERRHPPVRPPFAKQLRGLLSVPSALLKVCVRKRKLEQRLGSTKGVRCNIQKLQYCTDFSCYVHSLAVLGCVYLPDTWVSPAQVTVGTHDPSRNGLVIFSKNRTSISIGTAMSSQHASKH